jgi:hypothetical protein
MSGTTHTDAIDFGDGYVLVRVGDSLRFIRRGTVLFQMNTTGIGLLGAAPVAQGSAYTQTFSTADKTHASPTAVNPAAVTEYTPHAAGATAVTSNAGTDLDTTAAALNTLVDECQVLETELSAVIVDLADVKALVNSVIDDLQALGLVG